MGTPEMMPKSAVCMPAKANYKLIVRSADQTLSAHVEKRQSNGDDARREPVGLRTKLDGKIAMPWVRSIQCSTGISITSNSRPTPTIGKAGEYRDREGSLR